MGRFFCEHPNFVLANVLLARTVPKRECYAPTRAFIQREEVLNFGLLLEPDPEVELSLSREMVRSASCVSDFTQQLAQRVMGRRLRCDRGGLGAWFAGWSGTRELTGRVRIAMEQSLDRDSRVMLVPERDMFGLQRIALDWRLGELDYRTMRRAIQAFGGYLAEHDIGRLRIQNWLLADPPDLPGPQEDEVGGNYHMGTTRMSADPRQGVVDADCRVHGMANLYIGGSSVFPSTGHANPTYTIVQLALRLGDHLAAILRR